jgi:hypothetical protein
MVVCGAAAYWLLTDDQFDIATPLVAADVHYSDVPAMLAAAGLGADDHPNLLTVRTDDIRRVLLSYPSIADAQVMTEFPNTVKVSLTERTPVFALRRPAGTYLIAGDGTVLAAVDEARAGTLGIPLIDDQRTQFVSDVQVGGRLPDIDLEAMLALGAITPATVGSAADSLALSVRDDDGFVISAQPPGWEAIFGNYTPNLRKTDLIPSQVQCLQTLIGADEAGLGTVYLAPLDGRCGTYLPAGGPRQAPTDTPRTSPTPKTPR